MPTTIERTPCQELAAGAVRDLLARDEIFLIDVREPDEHRQEHIAGARSQPLGSIDDATVKPLGEKLIVLHCRGGTRSRKAAQKLRDAGMTNIAELRGGIDAWIAAGLPTIVDRRVRMTAMQQTQLLMGALVLVGTLLGAFVTPWALLLSGFIGCGMMFAGITGNCAMANVLAKAPWNRSISDANCSDGTCSL